MNETQAELSHLDRAMLSRRNDFLKLLDLISMAPVTTQNLHAAALLAEDLKDYLPFGERAHLYADGLLNCDEWLEKVEARSEAE